MDNELLPLQMHSITRLVAANCHLYFSMLSKPALMENPNHPLQVRGEKNNELAKS